MLIPYDNMIAIDTRKSFLTNTKYVCLCTVAISRNAMLNDIELDGNRSKEQLPFFRRPLSLNRHPSS